MAVAAGELASTTKTAHTAQSATMTQSYVHLAVWAQIIQIRAVLVHKYVTASEDCVEPGTAPVRQNIDMPFMEVMPRDIPVSSEVFSPRRVAVNLVTEVPAVALVSTTIPVTITAPPDIEVSCDAESSTTGNYFSSCILNTWKL